MTAPDNIHITLAFEGDVQLVDVLRTNKPCGVELTTVRGTAIDYLSITLPAAVLDADPPVRFSLTLGEAMEQ